MIKTTKYCKYLELTIAAAPETLVSPCLSGLNMCNFNRISVEALCASDKMLDYLGTSHRLADLEDGLTMLGMFKYRNVNADVMYGIPGQTKAALRNSLVTCLALPALSHITLKRFELSEQEGVSAEECRDQYRYNLEYLKEKGFCQYAVGHFAKKGYESRHFYYTSQGMDHIGFGVGAKSYVDGYGITNTTDLAKYLKWAGQYEEITENVLYLDEKARQKRFAALRLQLAEGFSEEEFAARFGEGAGAAMGPSLQLLLKQSLYKLSEWKVCTHCRLRWHEGKLLSTKPDPDGHGAGISIIDLAVQEYGGNVSIDAAEDWFALNILFPKTKRDEDVSGSLTSFLDIKIP